MGKTTIALKNGASLATLSDNQLIIENPRYANLRKSKTKRGCWIAKTMFWVMACLLLGVALVVFDYEKLSFECVKETVNSPALCTAYRDNAFLENDTIFSDTEVMDISLKSKDSACYLQILTQSKRTINLSASSGQCGLTDTVSRLRHFIQKGMGDESNLEKHLHTNMWGGMGMLGLVLFVIGLFSLFAYSKVGGTMYITFDKLTKQVVIEDIKLFTESQKRYQFDEIKDIKLTVIEKTEDNPAYSSIKLMLKNRKKPTLSFAGTVDETTYISEQIKKILWG